jgi:hypothetical protein
MAHNTSPLAGPQRKRFALALLFSLLLPVIGMSWESAAVRFPSFLAGLVLLAALLGIFEPASASAARQPELHS